MHLDDEVCLCFHVTKRKLDRFLKVENVTRPSQLSNCQGAGTGCGWCIPYLHKLFEQAKQGSESELPSSDWYAEQRQEYIRQGKGQPPESR